MALPPSDVGASELFLKLLERPGPSEVVDFPRAGIGKVRICVLHMEKHTEAKLRGRERLQTEIKRYGQVSTLGQTVGEALATDVLGDLVACELIAIACHEEKAFSEGENGPRYRRLFPDGASVEKMLTADEIASLFALYKAVQRKYGPIETHFESDEEVNAWIHRIGEGADAFPLDVLQSHQLAELCTHLISRASVLSTIIQCQRASLPINWASIPASWDTGISSSGELASGSIPLTPSAPISLDEAKSILRLLRGSTD